MLTLRSLRTSTRVDTPDLKTSLLRLARGPWKPAVIESQRVLAKLAGAGDEIVAELGGVVPTAADGYGDLVFTDDCVYYLLSSTSDPAFLEVGVVHSDSATAESLDEFAREVQDTILEALDGRKTRHMRFEWSEVNPSSYRLDRIIASERKEAGIELQRAAMTEQELAAAETLETRAVRSTLVSISQAGFAREHDILSRRGKAKEEAKSTLDKLKRGQLVAVEYIVECKKANSPITRLKSPEELRDPAIAKLKCPTCGRAFPDETLSEAYSVSELGKRMLQKSHWMTISVTQRLVEIGVPLAAILWNVSEGGEEIDLVVDVLGDLWLFELKDREFGSGDAHPFNYRQVRYKASKAVVVTTEKVSTDAKKVFQELTKETRGERPTPTYIEGLENTEPVLRKEIESSYWRHAVRKLLGASRASGYDLRPLLKARLGELPKGLARWEERLEPVFSPILRPGRYI